MIIIFFIETSSGAHVASSSVGNGGSFAWGQAAGCKVDYLPPSSAKEKNEWSYTSASLICHLDMYRDSFTVPYHGM
jgi:hypothetical protein